MSAFSNILISDKQIVNDFLRVNATAGTVNWALRLFKYRDKDTRQIVLYLPSLEISGYGNDDEKAIEMLNFSMKEYCDSMLSLPPKKIVTELIKMGWKKNSLRKKEFSKSFVDMKGELQNLNAVGNEVELLTVEA